MDDPMKGSLLALCWICIIGKGEDSKDIRGDMLSDIRINLPEKSGKWCRLSTRQSEDGNVVKDRMLLFCLFHQFKAVLGSGQMYRESMAGRFCAGFRYYSRGNNSNEKTQIRFDKCPCHFYSNIFKF